MLRLLWICLGGAVGSGARYLVGVWAAQRLGAAFPFGTLIVNIVGCFVIAVLMQAALSMGWSATLRSALTVGFVGGLTTYSSFNFETLRLVQEGAPAAAMLNVAITLAGGAAAGWLGLVTSRALLTR